MFDQFVDTRCNRVNSILRIKRETHIYRVKFLDYFRPITFLFYYCVRHTILLKYLRYSNRNGKNRSSKISLNLHNATATKNYLIKFIQMKIFHKFLLYTTFADEEAKVVQLSSRYWINIVKPLMGLLFGTGASISLIFSSRSFLIEQGLMM